MSIGKRDRTRPTKVKSPSNSSYSLPELMVRAPIYRKQHKIIYLCLQCKPISESCKPTSFKFATALVIKVLHGGSTAQDKISAGGPMSSSLTWSTTDSRLDLSISGWHSCSKVSYTICNTKTNIALQSARKYQPNQTKKHIKFSTYIKLSCHHPVN